MATQCSVLAWRIPGTAEPGGLPSVGSQSRTRLRRRGSGSSVRCSTVLLFFSRVWLCVNPSLQHAGYPVLHHFPELAQAHVHRVGDATQPSHPLLPLLLLPSILPSIRVFSNESALPIRWPEYWSVSFSGSISITTKSNLLIIPIFLWLFCPQNISHWRVHRVNLSEIT